MNKFSYIFLFLALGFNSCELIKIGETKLSPKIIDLTQKNPLSTVYLFKAELDSFNMIGATQLLANQNGKKYLAVERYDMQYDVNRFQRFLSNRPITFYKSDTIALNLQNVIIEFDYRWKYKFSTLMLGDKWYITNYERISD